MIQEEVLDQIHQPAPNKDEFRKKFPNLSKIAQLSIFPNITNNENNFLEILEFFRVKEIINDREAQEYLNHFRTLDTVSFYEQTERMKTALDIPDGQYPNIYQVIGLHTFQTQFQLITTLFLLSKYQRQQERNIVNIQQYILELETKKSSNGRFWCVSCGIGLVVAFCIIAGAVTLLVGGVIMGANTDSDMFCPPTPDSNFTKLTLVNYQCMVTGENCGTGFNANQCTSYSYQTTCTNYYCEDSYGNRTKVGLKNGASYMGGAYIMAASGAVCLLPLLSASLACFITQMTKLQVKRNHKLELQTQHSQLSIAQDVIREIIILRNLLKNPNQLANTRSTGVPNVVAIAPAVVLPLIFSMPLYGGNSTGVLTERMANDPPAIVRYAQLAYPFVEPPPPTIYSSVFV